MNNFTVNFPSGKTDILFGNYFEQLNLSAKSRRIIIVCDQLVNKLYPKISEKNTIISIEALESEKTMDTAGFIYNKLIELKADRSTLLIAIGGGIVCDITGFVAATFYRGMPVILIPTTLLAMADAAIGGKNGMNVGFHKNLTGTIRQPEVIIIDTSFLKTLPIEEFRNGIAEIIKHAVISGDKLFSLLENNSELKSGTISKEILKIAMQVKIDIVLADEQETGLRRILNFGHTFGHIIELSEGMRHGEAVCIGMAMAAKLSERLNKCNQTTTERLLKLLNYYQIPSTSLLDINVITRQLVYDKKKYGNDLYFVFLEGIGKVVAERISHHKLEHVLLNIFHD